MNSESLIRPPQSKVLKSGRVTLAPGEEVGWHVTDKREELLIILKGTATLMQGNESKTLTAGQTDYIKEEVRHNVVNNTDHELEYVYVVSLFPENI